MDDCPEIVLKTLCCTCLCRDRKLFQLCRITDGVNNLYWLLSYDSEAYREGFYKDTASLFICWECKAVLCRATRFREQACVTQKQLSGIADGRTDVSIKSTSLSQLSLYHKTEYDQIYISKESDHEIGDNFIDCGLEAPIIKSEDEIDDIPLSELHNNYSDDTIDNDLCIKSHFKRKEEKHYKKKKKTKIKLKKQPSADDNKKYFTTTQMTEKEMQDSREQRKMTSSYVDAAFKCEACIEGFRMQIELDNHNLALHTEKQKHKLCPVCLVYTKPSLLEDHCTRHYSKHSCKFCDYISYEVTDILTHLKAGHAMQNIVLPERRKVARKTRPVLRPGSKPRRSQAMTDKRTPRGYLCTECDKYFDNKNQRWKHVQRHHRAGFKCGTCNKRFAFRNNLTRHEQMHQGPPAREECPSCHKMIRSDLVKIHSRIHSERERFSCIECEKHFVSRASYEHHLKYTQAHAATDILKYKCSKCDKGYRSRGELRDHFNYQHMGKTQHKCPICDKALATRRCITRHVRRAHHGVKEAARDKICQQCGKAFRDKKGLREHEFIHTGERPLSCELCGCTFRQSASLYTHKKRVHKIYPHKRNLELMESGVEAIESKGEKGGIR